MKTTDGVDIVSEDIDRREWNGESTYHVRGMGIRRCMVLLTDFVWNIKGRTKENVFPHNRLDNVVEKKRTKGKCEH